jgi:hypothetical protein
MAYSWGVTNVPSKLLSNGILAICPKNKPFFAETLKAEKQWHSHQSGYRQCRILLSSYDG